MKILLSNDDGYHSPGLEALYKALISLEKVSLVTVVAPERDHSGASNSLTLSRPLYVTETSHQFNHFKYVNGTPTDCVHLALTGLLKSEEMPDIVIAGINNGQNMAEDTLYSGTVAAATEGYLFGIPSFAFSLEARGWENLDSAAKVASEIIQFYIEDYFEKKEQYEGGFFSKPMLFNVNIPNLSYEKLKTWSVTKLGKRHKSEPVICGKDPHGRAIYWISPVSKVEKTEEGTDFHAISQGHVSITPLQLDLTHKEALGNVFKWIENKKLNK